MLAFRLIRGDNNCPMAEFDPVPDEYLLTAEQASLYIPKRYIDAGSVGDVTPREFALQVLVDENPDGQAELALFQRQASDGHVSVFELMKYWMDMGGGRHTQHMIIAMSLHQPAIA